MAVNPLAIYIPEGNNQDPQLQDWAWRRKLAEALSERAQKSGQGIQHWTQGAAHLVDQLGAGLSEKRLRDEQKAAREGAQKFWDDHLTRQSAPGGSGTAIPGAAPVTTASTGTASSGPDLRPHIAEAMIPDGGQGMGFDGVPGGAIADEMIGGMESITMPGESGPGIAAANPTIESKPPVDNSTYVPRLGKVATPQQTPTYVPRLGVVGGPQRNLSPDGQMPQQTVMPPAGLGGAGDIPGDMGGAGGQVPREALAAALSGQPQSITESPAPDSVMGGGITSTAGFEPKPMGRDLTAVLTGGKMPAPYGWAGSDPRWAKLDPYQKAAAMALMEADGMDPQAARHALSAMINRAGARGENLGAHVSGRIYQPTMERKQQARLQRILANPEHANLTQWAQRRAQGLEDDPTGGATHFLAHEPVMERLQAREPGKYKSWVGWSGYNRGGGQYSNPDGSPVFRDKSHAFLKLEGQKPQQVAQADAKPAQYAQAGGEGQFTTDQLRTMLKNPHLAPMAQRYILEQMGPIGRDAQLNREAKELAVQNQRLEMAGKLQNLTDPKEKLQVIDGQPYWVNERTQQMRPADGAFTPKAPEAIRTQAMKADHAYGVLNKALDRYVKLAKQHGITAMPGPAKDALGEELRFIQMQVKELSNLGVLNGPDLMIISEMLHDPRIGLMSGWSNVLPGTGDVGKRTEASAERFRQKMSDLRDGWLAQTGQQPRSGGQQQQQKALPPGATNERTYNGKRYFQMNGKWYTQ